MVYDCSQIAEVDWGRDRVSLGVFMGLGVTLFPWPSIITPCPLSDTVWSLRGARVAPGRDITLWGKWPELSHLNRKLWSHSNI